MSSADDGQALRYYAGDGEDLRDQGREVLVPIPQQVEELVQAGKDRQGQKTDIQDQVSLVSRLAGHEGRVRSRRRTRLAYNDASGIDATTPAASNQPIWSRGTDVWKRKNKRTDDSTIAAIAPAHPDFHADSATART